MTVRVTREAEPQIEIYGAYSGELLGSGNGIRATVTFTPTDKYLILVVKGDLDMVQLEAGAFPTSYIPTTGATATRAADICSIATSAFGYNQKAGTVVVEFEVPTDHGTSTAIAGLGSDSYLSNNSSKISMSSSSARHLRVFSDAGVSLFEIDAGATPIGQVVKQAFAIKSGNHAAVIDGGTVATSSDANALPNPTRLYVGPPYNHIKSIAYYPRRLTNAQLQALTA